MSTQGNDASTATGTRDIQSEGRGIDITFNEVGEITAGRAKLVDGVALSHDAKLEVYDSAGAHLGSSDVLENGIASTLGYFNFTFTTTIPIDNETVRTFAWGDNTGGSLGIAYDGGAGRNFGGGATFPTPPDPHGGGTDGRYYAISLTVTPASSRSVDSINSFRRGDVGSIISCTGLDAAPATQTVTVTDGTHSDTCTVNSWSATAIDIDVDCALSPGTYSIQVTDDTGTVTLTGQVLLIETGGETIVFDGNTPPVDERSLSAGLLADHPGVVAVVNDVFGVESDPDVTWGANGQATIDPLSAKTLWYWFFDISTSTMYTGTINISQLINSFIFQQYYTRLLAGGA